MWGICSPRERFNDCSSVAGPLSIPQYYILVRLNAFIKHAFYVQEVNSTRNPSNTHPLMTLVNHFHSTSVIYVYLYISDILHACWPSDWRSLIRGPHDIPHTEQTLYELQGLKTLCRGGGGCSFSKEHRVFRAHCPCLPPSEGQWVTTHSYTPSRNPYFSSS